MKLSYTTLSVPDKSMERAVAIAVGQGLDGIELRGRDRIHISPSCDFSYVFYVKKLIEEHELAIPCLTAYTRFWQPSLKAVYQEVEELKPMIALAEYLGAHTVRVFMGAVPEGLEPEILDKIAREGLIHAAKVFAGSPVKLAIETHDSAKDGKTLAQLLTGVPEQIGILLDIIHPWDMGESIEETWQLVGRRIYHVHIKDITKTVAGGRIYSNIGAGILPVKQIVTYLNQKGYQGFYSLEWEQSADPAEGIGFEEQMESFISFMRRLEEDGNHNTVI